MDLLLLALGGMVIGVMVAAPVGPVNLICIRRTLAFGRLNGFLSGTGAALGDGVFAIVVAFGLTAASSLIQGYFPLLKTLGGILLLGIGWQIYFSNPQPFVNAPDSSLPDRRYGGGLVSAVVSTFLLTVTNPATMGGFMALFAALFSWLGSGFTENLSYGTAAILAVSVIVGSSLWWAMLAGVMGMFKDRFSFRQLQLLNRGSGLLIGLIGVAALVHVVVSWL